MKTDTRRLAVFGLAMAFAPTLGLSAAYTADYGMSRSSGISIRTTARTPITIVTEETMIKGILAHWAAGPPVIGISTAAMIAIMVRGTSTETGVANAARTVTTNTGGAMVRATNALHTTVTTPELC